MVADHGGRYQIFFGVYGLFGAASRQAAAGKAAGFLREVQAVEVQLWMPVRPMGEGTGGGFRAHHAKVVHQVAMDGVREDGIDEGAGEHRAIVGDALIVIDVDGSVQPMYHGFVLGARGTYGVDENIAVRSGGNQVAPVAMGVLRTLFAGANRAEKFDTRGDFERGLDRAGGVEQTVVRIHQTLDVKVERDHIPGIGPAFPEIGIRGDDGTLLTGAAEAGMYGRVGADSGEINQRMTGVGEDARSDGSR